MSKPTLLAELYHFLLDSGVVHISELEARFPNEFRTERESRDALTGHTKFETTVLSRRRMSEKMKDAICFLITEEFVELLPSGSIVRRHAIVDRADAAASPWHTYTSMTYKPTAADATRN